MGLNEDFENVGNASLGIARSRALKAGTLKDEPWTADTPWLGQYTLDEHHEPVKATSLLSWALWMEKADRQLAYDDLGGFGMVSTIFIGLDQTFHYAEQGARPVLWESLVYHGPHHGSTRKYSSRKAALEGHAALVEMCKSPQLKAE
jgi:hypothetical protein